MATSLKSRCPKCAEMQRSYLKTLEDKRTLLVKLQNEQERCRKADRELETLRVKEREWLNCRTTTISSTAPISNEAACNISVTSAGSSSTEESRLVERQLCEAMEINKKWKTEYQELNERFNTETTLLKDELQQVQNRHENSKTHVLALESEVMRLAEALRAKQSSGSNVGASGGDLDIFKHQMQAYKDDFSSERRDRERIQTEKDNLQEQLQNSEEIIATLTQEMEMYKEQYERLQEENHALSSRQYPAPNQMAQPQLQIVYPIGEPNAQEQLQWQQRRQQQHRRGVFTRGPTLPPPSVFYGGDVEIDKGSTHRLNDGYRTV